MFLSLVIEDYDPAEIALRDMKAIGNLSQGKSVGARFTNMVDDLTPYLDWRAVKLAEVNACTTFAQVDAIVVSYP